MVNGETSVALGVDDVWKASEGSRISHQEASSWSYHSYLCQPPAVAAASEYRT